MRIEEVQQMIDERRREDGKLEYKAGAWLRRDDLGRFDLRKWVTSFANSAGGRLIIGVTEEPDNNEVIPNGIEPVDINNFAIEPEKWIEDVLGQNIHPPLIPFPTIETIQTTDQSRVIIVIDTPRTMATLHNVIHGARESYFHRHNFQVTEMEEWEVRAILSNRRPQPTLRLRLGEPAVSHAVGPNDDPDQVYLDLTLENVGLVAAKSIQIGIVVASPPFSCRFASPTDSSRFVTKQNSFLLEGMAERFETPNRISVDSLTGINHILHPYDHQRIRLRVKVREWKDECRRSGEMKDGFLGAYLLAEEMQPIVQGLTLRLLNGCITADLAGESDRTGKILVGLRLASSASAPTQ